MNKNILLYPPGKDNKNIVNKLNIILKLFKYKDKLIFLSGHGDIKECLYTHGVFYFAIYIDKKKELIDCLKIFLNYLTHDGCILMKINENTLYDLYINRNIFESRGFEYNLYDNEYVIIKRIRIIKVPFRVVLLTKNEKLMLPHFLDYYGYIFHFHNIMVVDNGSNYYMKDIYIKYINKGIIFIRDNSEFTKAMFFMENYINFNIPFCEYVAPLETDEIICPIEYSNINLKDKIIDIFSKIPKNIELIRYKNIYESVIDYEDENYKLYKNEDPLIHITKFNDFENEPYKVIIRASSFKKIRRWCHEFETINNTYYYCNDLLFLHYTNINVLEMYKKSLEVFNITDTKNRNKDIFNHYINKNFCYHKALILLYVDNRMIIKNIFINHLNKYPELDEYEKLMSLNLEDVIVNCNEYIKNIQKEDKFIEDKNKDDLYLQIKNLNFNNSNDNVFPFTFDILKKYMLEIRKINYE
jgi:hypothetical protein